MTKRRPNGHKKTSRPRRRRWLRQIGGGVAVVAVLGAVVLAVVGMTRGGGSDNSARQPEITPVVEEESTQTAPRAGGPAIAFDVTSVDFGDVPLNTPVSYAFPFANTGDATLQIEDVQVKTSGGLLTVPAGRRFYDPEAGREERDFLHHYDARRDGRTPPVRDIGQVQRPAGAGAQAHGEG